jgi:CheY-like chemotaxis protein
LTVETANFNRGPSAGPVQLTPGDYVVVSISDTGTGMTDEVKARAFDPFFTTKDVGKGTGLGLSQVYGIAGQSGGTATIDSATGQGTTVRIYLPRVAEGAEGQRSQARRPTDTPVRSGARVLVVDDDHDVREVIVESLCEFGYDVTAVSSGGAALDALHSGSFEAVVMDFAMPGMNGADLGPIIRGRWPGLPVLLITGHAATASRQGPAGWTAMLGKPFVAAELDAKLRSLLGRRAESAAETAASATV